MFLFDDLYFSLFFGLFDLACFRLNWCVLIACYFVFLWWVGVKLDIAVILLF